MVPPWDPGAAMEPHGSPWGPMAARVHSWSPWRPWALHGPSGLPVWTIGAQLRAQPERMVVLQGDLNSRCIQYDGKFVDLWLDKIKNQLYKVKNTLNRKKKNLSGQIKHLINLYQHLN